MRYNQLLPIIKHNKPSTIVEIGTWNGLRAVMMAEEALKHQDKVHYIGFDLFEDATDETDERELNVKSHCHVNVVRRHLDELVEKHEGFTYMLYKGDTREIFKEHKLDDIDLAFVDGGHSIETVENDYNAVKHAKVVVLDDYYVPENGHPDITKYGCNFLVERDGFLVLPHADPVKDGGKVQMAMQPSQAWPGKMNLMIKTKNCVPSEEIHRNIEHHMEHNQRFIPMCEPHSRLAVVVSGGPSHLTYLNEIRKKHEDGAYVVCVKHSHDNLIETGIVPWGCMLLDPRDHVQDFIENPHSKVNYFVASMCHPTTFDQLKKHNAKIWGYHAIVGAEEEKVVKRLAETPESKLMVGGGSTSAVRGVSVLYMMGFRRFHLYGLDSCYGEAQDTTIKTKTGHQKYYKVEVSGRKFWTDSELLAQAQDFEKLMKQRLEMQELEVFGDGMIQHIWSCGRTIHARFEDIFSG